MTNSCRRILLIVCVAVHVTAVTAGDIELLPATRIVPPFTANATEHRLSLAKVFEENRYIAGFGAVVPLAEFRAARTAAQISIAGSFYTHLSAAEHQFIVTTGDYFVDALLDVQPMPAFAIRAGLGHTSQHLMDDALEVTGLPHSINYVRDYAQLFAIHKNAAIGGFLYAGCFYNYTFIINDHRDGTMIYELGGEALNAPVAPLVRFYIAADIKLKGESAFGTTQNYQVGVKLAHDDGGRTLRCAVNYQTGLEERGQFFGRRISQTVLGIYLDL
jgi:hypothetical protein